jgi:3-dehydroquinate synthase II
MKVAWVKVDPWDKSLVTTALEGGAAAVMVPEGYHDKVKELGRIITIAPDGDLKPDREVVFYEIESQEDEEEILKLAVGATVVVQTTDWTIIPLENLVAQADNIFAEVTNSEEARIALSVLEQGVAGILIQSDNPAELKKTLAVVREQGEEVRLSTARVVSVREAGLGDRACVDTCTQMGQGQGMLIGNSSSALFLIHAESVENPYVSPRPFRVNAGPVHAYIRRSSACLYSGAGGQDSLPFGVGGWRSGSLRGSSGKSSTGYCGASENRTTPSIAGDCGNRI